MWKVADWQESDVVTEPFEGCASTSHFRRLSWSPDGSVLCATHAFSSKKNIAALLNRGSWTNDLKFVGHQGVVTSARFNPKLLEKSTTSPRLAANRNSVANTAPTVVTHTTNTLIPKKKKKLGAQVPSTPQNRPPSGASNKTDKKRIAPVLQTEAQTATNNPASSQNNIRNILGPTIVSPTASDVNLLDTRMASASGKEVSVVPDTNNSATLKPNSAPGHSEKNVSSSKEKPVTASASEALSKSVKMDAKKNGVSLKRKRENERPPSQAATVVAKSREVVARPPKLLNESTAGVASGGQLLPEFPFRLLFSVEIDTTPHSSSSNGRVRDGLSPSKLVVEVTVHNLKNPQPEEIIGKLSYLGLISIILA
ncbi:unnamed protein product [Phytophthora lilii]|uniref:Unnamed protein product n=1 Tax=Phytophthora lilii TaxID=2077276 RepID=A0A9W6TFH6_9STRA|nr:unnamed protein product [Phytophthora lilii]